MSTRTIEPIHVVLPDADGGYYRFGDLPRLIADFLYPEDPDADEEAQELQWMKHGWDGVETFQEDLARAAGLTDGEPGYLHVVENSASKRPLKRRMGAVLEAGLVHLDWLNEWGESRKPQLVFSTVSAPEPQAATPAPVAGSAGGEPPTAWHLMASPHELCAAFGTFTGMNKDWFTNLNDKPALKAARFRPGQGGRNKVEPLFYVYPVLQWLIDKRRKTGKPMQEATGWRMLKQHFPMVYEAYELSAPDPD